MIEMTLSQFEQLFATSNDSVISLNFSDKFSSWLSWMQLPPELKSTLQLVYIPVVNLLRHENLLHVDHIPVIGISGAQGSGKSTFTILLAKLLEEAYGYRVVSFSIDDFYHTHAEREKLAEEIHPLLVTRGVPGTHDVQLGMQILEQLQKTDRHSETFIPVFDKSIDDRKPQKEWTLFRGRPDVVLFEGWCVGAIPQETEELEVPLNDLEKEKDKNGIFRKFVNDKLSTTYKTWFSYIDFLIMLCVPSFDQVYEWRLLQEKKMTEKILSVSNDTRHLKIMSEDGIRFFISHYERITKHMLEEMPSRANLVFRIGEDHHFRAVVINHIS